jgi:hypothetical protein
LNQVETHLKNEYFTSPKLTYMKRTLFLSLFCAFILASCSGGSGESSDTTDSTEASTEMPAALQRAATTVDLSDYFVNVTLTIPDSSRGLPMVEANDFGETRVVVGSIYNLVITELIEGDINSYVEALKGDGMYQNEVVEQGDDFVLYKSVIADSHVDPEFHFFAIKNVDGIDFEFHDYNEEGGYAESVARYMLDSVNHLKRNNQSS